MVNPLQTLIGKAVSTLNNGKIQLDEEKASALIVMLGRISSEINSSAVQIEGPISETTPVWTGKAAEEFFTDLKEAVKQAKVIGEKVDANRQKINNAVSIIMAAEKKNQGDVIQLSERSAFNNK